MANLAEPLELIVRLRLEINKGSSVKAALQHTLQSLNSQFAGQVKIWFLNLHQNSEKGFPSKSIVRVQLIHLIQLGLQGVPVSEPLEILEKQMLEICNEDIEAQVDRLPVLMTVPMIFCFLPAFLVLILGPVVSQFY